MAIVDRHIDPVGLGPIALNVLNQHIVSAKASTINAVVTRASAFSAATLNSTQAPGTAVDYPRNLVYQLSVIGGTASSAIISGGSIVCLGSNIFGNSFSESIALTSLAAASVPVVGAGIFASLGTVSYSNVSLHTGSSTNSSCVSFSVGVGNIIGAPQTFRSTNAVPFAWIGTAGQPGSFTVQTKSVPTPHSGGVSFSNALATNTPVQFLYFRTR